MLSRNLKTSNCTRVEFWLAIFCYHISTLLRRKCNSTDYPKKGTTNSNLNRVSKVPSRIKVLQFSAQPCSRMPCWLVKRNHS